MKKNRGFVFSILLIFLSSCSTVRPPDAKPFTEVSQKKEGFAIVYIYRPHTEIGSAVWPEVYINNAKTVALKNDTHTVIYLKPGKYNIHTEKSSFFSFMGNIPGEFEITGTNDHYLLFDRYYCGEHSGHNNAQCVGLGITGKAVDYERWIIVPKNRALRHIRKTYYVEPYVTSVDPQ